MREEALVFITLEALVQSGSGRRQTSFAKEKERGFSVSSTSTCEDGLGRWQGSVRSRTARREFALGKKL